MRPAKYLAFLSTILFISQLRTSKCDNRHEKTTVPFIMVEELPVGSNIGSLSDKIHVDILAERLQFVSLTEDRLIKINRTNGLLSVRERIDREALCRDKGTCCQSTFVETAISPELPGLQNPSCVLQLIIMNANLDSKTPQESTLIQVDIYVTDLNDNAPSWSPDKLEIEIPEHTKIGRIFKLPEAADPDQGPDNTVQTYRLIPSDVSSSYTGSDMVVATDAFELSTELVDRPTGMPFKYNLGLKVKADLDREKHSTYHFLLVAVDGGSPHHTGTLSVTVRISDINDRTPYFRQPYPTIELQENTPVGNQIYTIVAVDEDPSDANNLEYRMGSTASSEVRKLFRIDGKTGAVTVGGEVDFEIAPTLPSSGDTGGRRDSIYALQLPSMEYGYMVPVEVTDRAHIAETVLRIRVLNMNDNPPDISISSHLQSALSRGELVIKEDEPIGTLIATISVSDADERGRVEDSSTSRSSLPYCSTTSPFFAIQPMNAGMGNLFKLVTAKALDHETKTVHSIGIVCHDSGQPVLSSKKHLTIRLEDVNDSPPVFEKPIYYARLREGLPVDSPIFKVHASDADTGRMSEIRYRIVNSNHLSHNDQLAFIDEKSGQIRSGVVFDRETTGSVNFTVEAVDCLGGNGSLCHGRVNSATAEVICLIDDINDCSPEFDQPSYEFVIQEGQHSKLSVGQVHAVDRDIEPRNSRVRYHISDEGDASSLDEFRPSRTFSITPNGEIFTNSIPIDREQTPLLTFSVVATDGGEPSLSSYSTVTVRVEDINDNGPQWIYPAPGPRAASVNISVYSTVGMVVARLEAVDPDFDINSKIEYEIVRGNHQGYFDIESHSGTLYLAKPLELSLETGNRSLPTSTPAENLPPASFALSLKATDGGTPPRSNTSILRIFLQTAESFPSHASNTEESSQRLKQNTNHYSDSRNHRLNGGFVDKDFLVMIVMIIITLLVSILLITAIVLLRCRQLQTSGEDAGHQSAADQSVAELVQVCPVKQHAWMPPPSQDSSAKSGYTLDSLKSGTATLEGATHYMTPSGHFVTTETTRKSIDGPNEAATYGRFSPVVFIPKATVTTATFTRTNPNGSPNQLSGIVYTARPSVGNMSPQYSRATCSSSHTNNAVGLRQADDLGRCYMTLNPELCEVECPYGQLGAFAPAASQVCRMTSPENTTLMKFCSNIAVIEPQKMDPSMASADEAPRIDKQKICRFRIEHSGSRPLLDNFDNPENADETVDYLGAEGEYMQMKRPRIGGCEDTIRAELQ